MSGGATPRPLVSVAMTTYAHERYLAQAIESVLAQDFDDYELVIAEDCSPDGTRAVAERYAADRPDRVRLLPSERNLGGRKNFARVLEATRGRYVSQLDGDDYFTDPRRTRRMVDVLEGHPELAWAFHGVVEVGPDGEDLGHRVVGDPGRRYTRVDLLHRCPAGSAGVLHRRPERWDFPQWWWDSPVGDWALHMLRTGDGEYAYVDALMAVHRQHSGGVWAGRSVRKQLEIRERGREAIARAFDERPDALLAQLAFHDRSDLGRILEAEGHFREAAEEYGWCLAHLVDAPADLSRSRLRRRHLRARLRSMLPSWLGGERARA